MSKLKVDEIRDTTDSTTIAPSIPALEERFCQAWVNFDGTGTIAIRDSFNVTSLTDDGTGDYVVNFTTAVADTNYCSSGTTGLVSGTTSAGASTNTHLTTSCNVFVFSTSTQAGLDRDYVGLTIFGGNV